MYTEVPKASNYDCEVHVACFATLPGRADVDNTPTIHGNKTLTIIWLVLNVWPSHLGLPVLISVILLSERIYRHPTFVNMCITWWIDGLVSSLLFWTGYQTGNEPPYELCLVQGSLLYGVPAITALSGFFLIHSVFHTMNGHCSAEQGTTLGEWSRSVWCMLLVPYATWIGCLLAAVAVGKSYPELVNRQQSYFFCAVNSMPLGIFMTVLSSLILAITVVLLVRLIRVMYRQWKAPGYAMSLDDLIRLLRVLAFGFLSTIGIVLEAFAAQMGTSPVPHLAMATLGPGIILIFGTQADILQALGIWKRKPDLSCRNGHIEPQSGVALQDQLMSQELSSRDRSVSVIA